MNPTALLFYVLFGLILFGMYIGIRRRLLPPSVAASLGVFGGIVTMALMALAQGNSFIQAIFVGVLVGGLISAATVAMAWYFQRNAPK